MCNSDEKEQTGLAINLNRYIGVNIFESGNYSLKVWFSLINVILNTSEFIIKLYIIFNTFLCFLTFLVKAEKLWDFVWIVRIWFVAIEIFFVLLVLQVIGERGRSNSSVTEVIWMSSGVRLSYHMVKLKATTQVAGLSLYSSILALLLT